MSLRITWPKFTIQKQPPEVFYKKRCSQKFHKNLQENPCARASFLIKLQAWGLRPATLLKKRLWHKYFPVNFVKFLTIPFLHQTNIEKCTLLCVLIFIISLKTFEINGKVCNTKNSYLKGERWFFLKLKKCLNRASMTTLSGIIVF